MASSWTRIHLELGVPPSHLTFDMIEQAAAEIDGERDDLDWKRELPKKAGPGEWSEFAKDVAAMANARGGLLVYGVRNDRKVTGVNPDAVNTEQLHKWLRANTQPFVAGVDAYTLASTDGGKSVLVVDVPASNMAPHFVLGTSPRERELHTFSVPFRYADHTGWLAEHEIARAYQDRFGRQAAVDQALTGHLDNASEIVLNEGDPLRAWLIVAARPQRPAPLLMPPPTRGEAREVLTATMRTADAMKGSWGRTGLMHKALYGSPQVGLRRWLDSNFLHVPQARSSKDRLMLLEQHHDGTTVYAAALSSDGKGPMFLQSESSIRLAAVDCGALEVGVCEAVAFAHEVRSARRNDSALDLTAVVVTQVVNRPMRIYGFGALVGSESSPVAAPRARCPARILPAGSELAPLAAPAALRACAKSLSSGLLNQFGLESDIP